MKYFILIILLIGFVSAVGEKAVNEEFECPDEIFVGEEFECSLEIFNGDGEYDIKIDLDGERDSVLELWNNGEWKSGYFYLKNFIKNEGKKNIKIKISKEGDWNGKLKLRQGNKREFFDISIKVERENNVNILDNVTKNNSKEDILLNDIPEVILLNDAHNVHETIYTSKDAIIINWLPYFFSLFLIFIIVFLLWERF